MVNCEQRVVALLTRAVVAERGVLCGVWTRVKTREGP
jgi:hypothetical protein